MWVWFSIIFSMSFKIFISFVFVVKVLRSASDITIMNTINLPFWAPYFIITGNSNDIVIVDVSSITSVWVMICSMFIGFWFILVISNEKSTDNSVSVVMIITEVRYFDFIWFFLPFGSAEV